MKLRPLPFLALAILLTNSCNRDDSTGVSVSIEPLSSDKIDLEVKSLAKELKKELLAALAEGKPAGAIGVCRDKAPEVTAARPIPSAPAGRSAAPPCACVTRTTPPTAGSASNSSCLPSRSRKAAIPPP